MPKRKEKRKYETSLSIYIPASAEGVSYDDGDYHFFISFTDHEGCGHKRA